MIPSIAVRGTGPCGGASIVYYVYSSIYISTVGLDFGAGFRVISVGYCFGALRHSFVGSAYILGSPTDQARELMNITLFLLYGTLLYFFYW